MKILTIIFIMLIITSFCFNIYFIVDNKLEQREKIKNINLNQETPEFMKNGEWFNIILNGYNGER